MFAPKEKKSIGSSLLVLCCFAALLQSCFLFGHAPENVGSLSITVPRRSAARTIEPTDSELAISSYRVEGISDDGIHSFDPVTATSSPITISGLAAGDWSITVYGKNGDALIVASKTQTVTILSGQNSSSTFDLEPAPGTGSMKLTLRWPESRSITKAQGAYTATATNVAQNFEWTLSGGITAEGYHSWEGQLDGLAAGSYTLVLRFFSGDTAIEPPYTDILNVYDRLTSKGTFTLLETSFPPAAPAFAPPAGTYDTAQPVTISSATAGAELYYTTDGTDPGMDSARYTGPVAVAANTTIKAIAVSADRALSSTSSAQYLIRAAAPSFNPAGGAYNSAQPLSLTSATSGAVIRYTLDGSDPGPSSPAYGSALTIASTTVVKAISTKSGMTDSNIAQATYTISGSSGLTIKDPSRYRVTIATPSSWTSANLTTAAEEDLKATVTPALSNPLFTWYLDGQVARNNLGQTASTSDTLSLGTGDADVQISRGAHQITAVVTVGAYSFSGYVQFTAVSPDGSLASGAALIRYGSRLYVAGGKDSSGSPVSMVRSAAVNTDGTAAALAADTSLPSALTYAAGIAAGKRLYILGGETPSGYSSQIYYAAINSSGNLGFGVPRVWLANPSALPAPRARAAAVLRDGWVYLIGGVTDSGVTDSIIRAHVYQDGKLGKWYPSSQTLPAKIHDAAAAVLGDRLYVAGGIGATGAVSGVVSYAFGDYGALSDRRIESALPLPLYAPVLAPDGDTLVLAGGYSTNGPSGAVYRLSSGAWSQDPSLRLDGEGPAYGRAAGSLWYLPRQFRNQDGAAVSAPLRSADFALGPEAPELTPGSGLVPGGMPLTILAEPGATLKYTKDGGAETLYSASSPPSISGQSSFTATSYLGSRSSTQIRRSYRVKTAAFTVLVTGTLPIHDPGYSALDSITIQEPTNNAAYPSGFEPAVSTMYKLLIPADGRYRLSWADADTAPGYSARLLLSLMESDLYTEVPDLTEARPVAALADASRSPLQLQLQAGTYYLLGQDEDGLKGRNFGLSLVQE